MSNPIVSELTDAQSDLTQGVENLDPATVIAQTNAVAGDESPFGDGATIELDARTVAQLRDAEAQVVSGADDGEDVVTSAPVPEATTTAPPSYDLNTRGGMVHAVLRVPLANGNTLVARATAKKAGGALAEAADLVKKAAASKVIAAVMPPQALAVMSAIRGIKALSESGQLKRTMSSITSSALKTIASLF